MLKVEHLTAAAVADDAAYVGAVSVVVVVCLLLMLLLLTVVAVEVDAFLAAGVVSAVAAVGVVAELLRF